MNLKSLALQLLVVMLTACVVATNPTQQSRAPLASSHTNAFFLKMPKGADLHTHYEGATYAENMLSLSQSEKFFVNMKDGSVFAEEAKDFVPIKQVFASTELKENIVRQWSLKEYNGENSHQHFFQAFGKFKPLTTAHKEDLIVEILNRALLQNISYVELMATPPKHLQESKLDTKDLSANASLQKQFDKWYLQLRNDGVFQYTETMRSSLNELEDHLTKRLSYNPFVVSDTSPIALRLIYPVFRNKTHGFLFARLAAAFDLASRDHRVVAVNLVAPEEHEICMTQYSKQMEMIAYFKKLYPKVATTLHAGELTSKLDPNKAGISHIRDAVTVAGARRIGHGTDVLRDRNPKELVALMVKKGTLVEVNLTSNASILGVQGSEHPLKFYLENKVPVALSTDDEGILRTNITKEYVRAFREQDLSYSELKQMARNSLHFAFLEGTPLWTNASYEKMNGGCLSPKSTKEQSLDCYRFLNENPKAKLQFRLEKEFGDFEGEYLAF